MKKLIKIVFKTGCTAGFVLLMFFYVTVFVQVMDMLHKGRFSKPVQNYGSAKIANICPALTNIENVVWSAISNDRMYLFPVQDPTIIVHAIVRNVSQTSFDLSKAEWRPTEEPKLLLLDTELPRIRNYKWLESTNLSTNMFAKNINGTIFYIKSVDCLYISASF